ncbi:MAG TPA: MFS transporter [Mycobacteriales bacterium]|nr:MFS transporter [Mycobacteriales bacterium]
MSFRPESGLRRLWSASALGGLAQSLAGSAGSLIAGHITGSDRLAGLPQGMLVIGAGAAAPLISGLASRTGRRTALASGTAAAGAGCLVLLAGAVASALSLILLGSVLLGAGNTAVMLSRYAAADLVPDAVRPRAMASILSATTVGAVIGPNLLGPTGWFADRIGLPGLAGSYLTGMIGYLSATAILAAGQRGTPRRPVPREATDLGPAVPALLVLALANLVMVANMTMTPPQLHHHGLGLTGIGVVISLHIAAMFAPAPVSGRIIQRYGPIRSSAAAGCVLLLACALGVLGANSLPGMTVAVAVLGAGWNLGMLAGSALLIEAPGDRFRRESWGEIGMGAAAGIGGVGSGIAMAGVGYAGLSAFSAVAAVLLVVFATNRPAVEGSRP